MTTTALGLHHAAVTRCPVNPTGNPLATRNTKVTNMPVRPRKKVLVRHGSLRVVGLMESGGKTWSDLELRWIRRGVSFDREAVEELRESASEYIEEETAFQRFYIEGISEGFVEYAKVWSDDLRRKPKDWEEILRASCAAMHGQGCSVIRIAALRRVGFDLSYGTYVWNELGPGLSLARIRESDKDLEPHLSVEITPMDLYEQHRATMGRIPGAEATDIMVEVANCKMLSEAAQWDRALRKAEEVLGDRRGPLAQGVRDLVIILQKSIEAARSGTLTENPRTRRRRSFLATRKKLAPIFVALQAELGEEGKLVDVDHVWAAIELEVLELAVVRAGQRGPSPNTEGLVEMYCHPALTVLRAVARAARNQLKAHLLQTMWSRLHDRAFPERVDRRFGTTIRLVDDILGNSSLTQSESTCKAIQFYTRAPRRPFLAIWLTQELGLPPSQFFRTLIDALDETSVKQLASDHGCSGSGPAELAVFLEERFHGNVGPAPDRLALPRSGQSSSPIEAAAQALRQAFPLVTKHVMLKLMALYALSGDPSCFTRQPVSRRTRVKSNPQDAAIVGLLGETWMSPPSLNFDSIPHDALSLLYGEARSLPREDFTALLLLWVHDPRRDRSEAQEDDDEVGAFARHSRRTGAAKKRQSSPLGVAVEAFVKSWAARVYEYDPGGAAARLKECATALGIGLPAASPVEQLTVLLWEIVHGRMLPRLVPVGVLTGAFWEDFVASFEKLSGPELDWKIVQAINGRRAHAKGKKRKPIVHLGEALWPAARVDAIRDLAHVWFDQCPASLAEDIARCLGLVIPRELVGKQRVEFLICDLVQSGVSLQQHALCMKLLRTHVLDIRLAELRNDAEKEREEKKKEKRKKKAKAKPAENNEPPRDPIMWTSREATRRSIQYFGFLRKDSQYRRLSLAERVAIGRNLGLPRARSSWEPGQVEEPFEHLGVSDDVAKRAVPGGQPGGGGLPGGGVPAVLDGLDADTKDLALKILQALASNDEDGIFTILVQAEIDRNTAAAVLGVVAMSMKPDQVALFARALDAAVKTLKEKE